VTLPAGAIEGPTRAPLDPARARSLRSRGGLEVFDLKTRARARSCGKVVGRACHARVSFREHQKPREHQTWVVSDTAGRKISLPSIPFSDCLLCAYVYCIFVRDENLPRDPRSRVIRSIAVMTGPLACNASSSRRASRSPVDQDANSRTRTRGARRREAVHGDADAPLRCVPSLARPLVLDLATSRHGSEL